MSGVDIDTLVASPHFRLMVGMPMRGVPIPSARVTVLAVTATRVLVSDAAPLTWPTRPSMDIRDGEATFSPAAVGLIERELRSRGMWVLT